MGRRVSPMPPEERDSTSRQRASSGDESVTGGTGSRGGRLRASERPYRQSSRQNQGEDQSRSASKQHLLARLRQQEKALQEAYTQDDDTRKQEEVEQLRRENENLRKQAEEVAAVAIQSRFRGNQSRLAEQTA